VKRVSVFVCAFKGYNSSTTLGNGYHQKKGVVKFLQRRLGASGVQHAACAAEGRDASGNWVMGIKIQPSRTEIETETPAFQTQSKSVSLKINKLGTSTLSYMHRAPSRKVFAYKTTTGERRE